jgi:hypothetical protein
MQNSGFRIQARRLLHQRDLYLRVEFIVGLIVVALVFAVAALNGAEPTPAQRSLGDVRRGE